MNFRNILAILAVLVLVLATYESGRRGVSSISEYFLSEYVDKWAESGVLPKADEWLSANSFYETAITFNPHSPNVLHKGAILYEWKSSFLENTLQQRRGFQQKSLDLYRKSISLRPTWPYVWSDFILAKIRMNEVDDEFQASYGLTQKLGSWEPIVQMGLIKSGLYVWTQLNQKNQSILKLTIGNALIVQFKKVTGFMREHDYLALMCYEMKGNKVLDEYCVQQGI